MLTLAVGDVVVYASHGIARVEARRAGAGDLPETIVLVCESGLRVTLPLARARHALRSPSGELELEDVRRALRAEAPLGIETVIGRVDGDDPRATIERLARHVLPVVAEVEASR